MGGGGLEGLGGGGRIVVGGRDIDINLKKKGYCRT